MRAGGPHAMRFLLEARMCSADKNEKRVEFELSRLGFSIAAN